MIRRTTERSQSGGVATQQHGGVDKNVITSRTKMSDFGTHKDVNLVNSWMELSCDPIINTGQRKKRLWDYILVQYNTKRGAYPEHSAR
jgi:hypothetical protein